MKLCSHSCLVTPSSCLAIPYGCTHLSKSKSLVCCSGVRIPDSDFIRGVCRDHGGAIALTSANISGAASPLCVNDFAHLWPLCAAVFNGMRIQADRAGSTIVDLSVVGAFKIVRPGVSLAVVQSLLQSNGLRQIE